MRARLVIEGRMPGLNEYARVERASRYEAARMKREWTGLVSAAARAHGMPRFDGPVEVSFLWVEPNRRRDLDNVAFAKKFVLDGLVMSGAIPDDSPAHVVGLADRFSYDRARPRVEVEVRDA